MFENINIQSSVAVYMPVENAVIFAVASGRLKAGDKLPSMHELSEKLKTNINTVGKAYRDLEVMGIVFTRKGAGVYINKGAEAKCKADCRQRILGRLNEVVAEAKAAGMTPQMIKAVCTASYASDGEPYGETPDAVMALAKVKKGNAQASTRPSSAGAIPNPVLTPHASLKQHPNR